MSAICRIGLATLCFIVMLLTPTIAILADEQVGLIEAFLTNAYALNAFDVVYDVDYSAKPSLKQVHEITLSKKLHGRQVCSFAKQYALWMEESIDMDASVKLNLDDAKKGKVIGVMVLGNFAGGKLDYFTHEKMDRPLVIPMSFNQCMAGHFRSLALAPLIGWGARIDEAGIDGFLAKVPLLGDLSVRSVGNDIVDLDFQSTHKTSDGRMVKITRSNRFNEKTLLLLSSVESAKVEGLAAEVIQRVESQFKEFNGLMLPIRIECTDTESTDAFATDGGEAFMPYKVTRVVNLKWSHVNEPEAITFPKISEINNSKGAMKFLGIEESQAEK
jgi:hypothetical protein